MPQVKPPILIEQAGLVRSKQINSGVQHTYSPKAICQPHSLQEFHRSAVRYIHLRPRRGFQTALNEYALDAIPGQIQGGDETYWSRADDHDGCTLSGGRHDEF